MKFRPEDSVSKAISSQSDRQQFLDYVGQVVAHVRRHAGGDDGWWVVGGLAREAVVGTQDLRVRYKTGEWRDVDLLFSEPLISTARRIKFRNPTPLPVEIVNSNVVRVLPGVRACLVAGRARVSVSPTLFESQMASLDGVEFPTLTAATLLHMYCVGIHLHGSTKGTDFPDMRALAHIARTAADRVPHGMYQGFHRFATMESGMERINRLAEWYWQTPFQRLLPLNHRLIYPCLERVWLGASSTQRWLRRSPDAGNTSSGRR